VKQEVSKILNTVGLKLEPQPND